MLKILIAEDDRELRQLFSHVLTKNGYTVKGVSNGQEALDAMDNDYFFQDNGGTEVAILTFIKINMTLF